MKLPDREGTLFAVPLRKGGSGVGLVARTTTKGRVLLCYLFGPHRLAVPTLSEVARLKPGVTIGVGRVGDLGLIRGEWPIIGQAEAWNRARWPMPQFVRRCSLSLKAWRVYRSDHDPAVIDRGEPEPYESTWERDGPDGAGSAEIRPTKWLTQEPAP